MSVELIALAIIAILLAVARPMTRVYHWMYPAKSFAIAFRLTGFNEAITCMDSLAQDGKAILLAAAGKFHSHRNEATIIDFDKGHDGLRVHSFPNLTPFVLPDAIHARRGVITCVRFCLQKPNQREILCFGTTNGYLVFWSRKLTRTVRYLPPFNQALTEVA